VRKFAILLIAALLISIPAFAIGNQPVAEHTAVVAAGLIDNTSTETVVTVEVTAEVDEQNLTDTVEGEEIASDEIAASPEPAAEEPAPVKTTAVEPVAKVAVVSTPAPVEAKVVPVSIVTVAPAAPVIAETAPAVEEKPVLLTPPAPVVVTADMPLIDTSKASQGIVTINYSGTAKARLEVRKGDAKYYYNLYKGQENFPLQLGSGQYTITVFENTTDNRYRAADRSIIDVSISTANSVFLASVQEIKWSEQSLATAKARQLTSSLSTDREKFEAIYRFVVANVDYDTPKLATLTSTYLPSIDQTLTSGKGICYDHASLMAAMLRSLGIPAKLVKGYASTVQGYHAWNEVYVDGQWLIVDASVDAQRRARGAEITMIKSSDVYKKTLEF
jgi:transglutaminase-like putative cysteine protease